MPGILSSDFSNPNETLSFDKATIQIVDLGGTKVFKGILEPGWKWSESVKEAAGTESCQARHIGIVSKGCLVTKHNDGSEAKLFSGETYVVEAGHDAWVEGNETVEIYEFNQGAVEVVESIPQN